MNEENRLDYFIVWGHATELLTDIIDIINESEHVDILYIKKKKIFNLEKFLDAIYANEWSPVPKEHTINKCKFLHLVPKEASLVLVMNKNPDVRTQPNKNPLFRMPESKTIVSIKTKIRRKFDPREGGTIPTVRGGGPYQHVVHASDFPEQIPSILTLFEIKNADYWRRYWQDRHQPLVAKNHNKNVISVAVDDILMNILNPAGRVVPTKIEESPHYKFLYGVERPYREYWDRFCGDILKENHSPAAFKKLANGFKYLEPPYQDHFIKVYEKDSLYFTRDGDHRLAIIKHLGHELIQVEV